MACFINLFADDISVQQPIIDITSFDKVNWDLQRISVFGKLFYAIKAKYMIISRQRNRSNLPNLFQNGD